MGVTGNAVIGKTTITPNSITNSDGSISFGSNNLVTTGNVNIGNVTAGDITSGDITSSGDATFSGIITAAKNSIIGNITIGEGSITSDSGNLTFSNENISTTGTLAAGATTITGNLTADSLDIETLSLTGGVNGAVVSSTSGGISFSDNNLSTTGNLEVNTATLSGDLIVGSTTIKESELGLIDGISNLGYSQNGKVITQDNLGRINIGSVTGGEVLDVTSHNGTNAGLKLGGVLVTAIAEKINNVSDTTGPIGAALDSKIDDSVAQQRYALKSGSTTFGSVGALSVGSIVSGFTKIEMGGPISTTGDLSSGSLQVDNVTIDGATIGFKQNATTKSDLVTLSETQVTVDGALKANTILIGNNAITATANEINKLDGVTSTTSELSLLSGYESGIVNSGSAYTDKRWSCCYNSNRIRELTGASGSKKGKVTVTDTGISGDASNQVVLM